MRATRSSSRKSALRQIATTALVEAFQWFLAELMADDFRHYEHVITNFMFSRDTLNAFNAFKANYVRQYEELVNIQTFVHTLGLMKAGTYSTYATARRFKDLNDVTRAKFDAFSREYPACAIVLEKFMRRDEIVVKNQLAAIAEDWSPIAAAESLLQDLQAEDLLIAEAGLDWYATTFACCEDCLLSALEKASLLTAAPGLTWYVGTFKQADFLYEAVSGLGLLSKQQPIEWFIETFGPKESDNHIRYGPLHKALDEAGWLTKERGYQWFKDTFDAIDINDSCHQAIYALRSAGMYTQEPGHQYYLDLHTFDGTHEMDVDTADALYDILSDLNMLTPYPGKEWYVAAFSGHLEYAYKALLVAGFLTPCARREWIAWAFRSEPGILLKALRSAGLLTNSATREWYLTSFPEGEFRSMALVEAGYD